MAKIPIKLIKCINRRNNIFRKRTAKDYTLICYNLTIKTNSYGY